MSKTKQHAKLLKVMAKADKCLDRRTSQKLLKKAAKINARLNK